MNTEEINRLIFPYQIFYDSKLKRNYFLNTKNGQSVWKLPQGLHQELQSYLQRMDKKPAVQAQETRNLYKFLPREHFKKQKKKFIKWNEEFSKREARKQVQTSLANTYAYKQGDQEYNIWYNKYINQKPKEIRQAALTRCEPEKDIGFTRGDLFDSTSSYFCLYFAKGCCSMGVKCRYLHRLPTIEDCQKIDNSRDIFGRKRFATVKDNQAGVGCFNKDTQVLYIQDFKLFHQQGAIVQLYESMFRHFSIWAEIQDINIIPHKNFAFIKFAHRCMAEFAKQAMDKQALDNDDILTIKWANQDSSPKSAQIQQKNQRRLLTRALQKKAEQQRKNQRKKHIKKSRDHFMKGLMKYRTE